ncbi:MAG: hypothetical protein ACKO48_01945, partial [Actinomycetota bacterium]
MSRTAQQFPALSLVASATRRAGVLQLAADAEARGFTHVACPSLGAAMPLCTSLAHVTTKLQYFTSIQPITKSDRPSHPQKAIALHHPKSDRTPSSQNSDRPSPHPQKAIALHIPKAIALLHIPKNRSISIIYY